MRKVLETGENPPGCCTDFGDEGSSLEEAVERLAAALAPLVQMREEILDRPRSCRFCNFTEPHLDLDYHDATEKQREAAIDAGHAAGCLLMRGLGLQTP